MRQTHWQRSQICGEMEKENCASGSFTSRKVGVMVVLLMATAELL